MKPGSKVEILRLHLAGVIAKTSLAAKDGAVMEWYPAGVLVVEYKTHRNVWYYAPNIIEVVMAADEKKAAAPAA